MVFKVILSVLVVMIIALTIFFAPMIEVTYYEEEPHTVSETYYEKEPYTETQTYYEKEPYTTTEKYHETEPYTAIETYYETEPYTTLVSIDYRVVEAKIYNWFWTSGSDCWVIIKNTDTKSGYFDVTFNLVTRGGASTTRTARKYIALADQEQVMVKHEGDYISTFTYRIDPPKKEVTRYHNVAKTREVIRYHNVEKSRPVTKYRDVEQTQEVTKYRDVEKTREVVRIRKVERTKRVPVFEYLADW